MGELDHIFKGREGSSPAAHRARKMQLQQRQQNRAAQAVVDHKQASSEAAESQKAAREEENSAVERYGLQTGRPTFTNDSGDTRFVHDDDQWSQIEQQSVAEKMAAAREERETERERSTKEAEDSRRSSLKTEAAQFKHQLDHPDLQSFSDSDRKEREEALQSHQLTRLSTRGKEIADTASKLYPDKAKREEVMARVASGDVPEELNKALRSSNPEWFTEEDKIKADLSRDDEIRGKRSEFEKKAWTAENKLFNPPEEKQPGKFDVIKQSGEITRDRESLAGRGIMLREQETQLKEGRDATVAQVEQEFREAVSKPMRDADFNRLVARKKAAILDAEAGYHSGVKTLADERIQHTLDTEELNSRIQKMAASSSALPGAPTGKPATSATPTVESEGKGQESATPAKEPAATSATPPDQSVSPLDPAKAENESGDKGWRLVDNPDAQETSPLDPRDINNLREQKAIVVHDLNTTSLAEAAERSTAMGGFDVYLRPDLGIAGRDKYDEAPLRVSRMSDVDAADLEERATGIVSAATESLNDSFGELVESVKAGEVTPEQAEAREQELLQGGGMSQEVSLPGGERVDNAGEEIQRIRSDISEGFLRGEVSLGQARAILKSTGIPPEKATADLEGIARENQTLGEISKGVTDLYREGGGRVETLDGKKVAKELLVDTNPLAIAYNSVAGLWDQLASDGAGNLEDFDEKTRATVEKYQSDVTKAADRLRGDRDEQVNAYLADKGLSDEAVEHLKLNSAREAATSLEKGFVESLIAKANNPDELMPFINDVAMLEPVIPVAMAVMKSRAGEELTPMEEASLMMYFEDSGRDHSVLGMTADILAQMPAFVSEIATTAGIATGVKKAGVKALNETLGKKLGKEITEEALKIQAKRSFGKNAGALALRGGISGTATLAQTPFAMGDFIAAETFKNMVLPDLAEFQGSDSESLQKWASEPGMKFGSALSKAGFDAFVEMASEKVGGPLSEIGAIAKADVLKSLSPAMRERLGRVAVVKAAQKVNRQYSATQFARFMRQGKFGGTFEEMLEERFGDVARAAGHAVSGGGVGEEFQMPTGKQIMAEFLAFGAPNSIAAVANSRAVSKAKKQNRAQMMEMTSTIEEMGDWSSTGDVARGLNQLIPVDGETPPVSADDLRAIEDVAGPISALPELARMRRVDDAMDRRMRDAESRDEMERLGNVTELRVAANYKHASAVAEKIRALKEAVQQSEAMQRDPDPEVQMQGAMLSGAVKVVSGRPAAEMTQAERLAWSQPLDEAGTLAMEEVNGRLIITDAGRKVMAGNFGEEMVNRLAPMSESKARRNALKPDLPDPAPLPKHVKETPETSEAERRAEEAVGSRANWTATGVDGTEVSIPGDDASTVQEAERLLARQLKGEMLDPDSVAPPSIRPREEGASNPVESEAEQGQVEPVVEQSAIDEASAKSNNPEQAATIGNFVADSLNRLNAGAVFAGVEFTEDSNVTMEVDPNTGALRINLDRLGANAKGPDHLAAAIIEEVIHAASTKALDPAQVAQLWQSLPSNLKRKVTEAYTFTPDAENTDFNDYQLGHEFLRMVIQDRNFRGLVTEAMAKDPGFAEELVALLRQLVESLRAMVDGLDADTRANVDGYADTVVETLREFGVSMPAANGDSAGVSRGNGTLVSADKEKGSSEETGQLPQDTTPTGRYLTFSAESPTTATAGLSLNKGQVGFNADMVRWMRKQSGSDVWDSSSDAEKLEFVVGSILEGNYRARLTDGPLADHLRAFRNEGGVSDETATLLENILPPRETSKAPADKKAKGIDPLAGSEKPSRKKKKASKSEPKAAEINITGDTATVYTSDNQPVEVQWAVIDASEAITSHHDDLSPNKSYDQSLQGRDRDTAASDRNINDIEGNTTFARLSDSSDTASGSPIIGANLEVESGNGRTIALRRAYRSGRDNVQQYKTDLIANAGKYGLEASEIESLKAPVLVRIRRSQMDRVAFAEDANRPSVAGLSAKETALADAESLDNELLSRLEVTEDGDLYTPSNQDFFHGFFRNTVRASELPNLVNGEGNLSRSGLDRVRNAVFVSAFGNDARAMRVFDRLAEEIDVDQRNLVNALVATSPQIARHLAESEEGRQYTTTFPEDLLTAADAVITARQRGEKVGEMLSQGQMFDEGYTPVQESLIRYIDANMKSGRAMSLVFRNTLELIARHGDPQQAALFDDGPPDLGEIVDRAQSFTDDKGRAKLIGSAMQEEMALAMAKVPEGMPADVAQEITESVAERIEESKAYDPQFQAIVDDIAADGKGFWFPLHGPVKKLDRSAEKAQEEWMEILADEEAPTVEKARDSLKDLVRASIVVQDAKEFGAVLESIGNRFTITRVKDRWEKPLPNGYADILVNVETPSGVAEIQIHIPEMLIAKEGVKDFFPAEFIPETPIETSGHKYYGIERDANASQEERDAAGPAMESLYFGALQTHFERTSSRPPNVDLNAVRTSSQVAWASLKLKGFASPKDPSRMMRRVRLSMKTAGRSESPVVAGSAPEGTLNVTDSLTTKDSANTEKDQALPFPSTLGIPREAMPQIDGPDQLRFLGSLKKKGISVTKAEVPVAEIRPTQAEWYPAKVAKAEKFLKGGLFRRKPKRIIVSKDGYLLDGHHQYLAASKAGKPLRILRIGLELEEAFEAAMEFGDVTPANKKVVRDQLDRSAQPPLSMAAVPQPLYRQADLFDYVAPGGATRSIPKRKRSSPKASPAAQDNGQEELLFQGNLFDWNEEDNTAILPSDDSAKPTRPKRRRSSTSNASTQAAGSEGSDQSGELGDLFTWAAGGPTGQSFGGSGTGQSGSSGGSGKPSGRGASGNTDSGSDDTGGTGTDRNNSGGDGGTGTGSDNLGDQGNDAGVKPPRKKRKPSRPEKRERPKVAQDRNFVIPDGFEPSPGSPKKRIEANFNAIKLLRTLEQEERNPTPEEKEALVAYSGWGSFKEAFNVIAYERNSREVADQVSRYGETWADSVDRRYSQDYRDRVLASKSWMDNHGELHKRLVEELTPEEFDAASVSIMNAHYTSADVIDSVWAMASKAGFKGGKALEPGGGVGHFIGRTPADLSERTEWDAVELDEVTSRILSKLYPEARVNSVRSDSGRVVSGQGFQNARIPNNSQDLVISNVPFYEKGPAESKDEFGIAFNLHNYFFARALAKAKPGGLVAFITTHNTMDASTLQRKWIAERSELVHAVRLPNTAFKKNAGTEVVTDIILLRKPDGSGRAPVSHEWGGVVDVGEDTVQSTLSKGDRWTEPTRKDTLSALLSIPQGWRASDPAIAEAWTAWDEKRPGNGAKYKALMDALFENALTENKNGVKIIRSSFIAPIEANEYFAENPHLVIGTQGLTGSMYRENEYNVMPLEGGEEAFLKALKQAAEAAPDVGQAKEAAEEELESRASDDGDRPGSFVERDGGFFQVAGDTLIPQKWKPGQEALFRSWSVVLGETESLLRMEQSFESNDADIEALRARVNTLFDTHVKRFGHPAEPNKRRNKHNFLADDSTGHALIQSLEEVDKDVDASGKVKITFGKAALLKGRVLKPIKEPDTADSIEDAVAASLSFRGSLDIGYMAQLRDAEESDVRSEIIAAGYAFEDPLSGQLVSSDEYLSGNVVEKLKAAQRATEDNPAYSRNVDALEEVRPQQKTVGEIGLNIGASWIPNSVYSAFVNDVLGYPGADVVSDSYVRSVKGIGSGGNVDYGTEKMSAGMIFEALLKKKSIEVRRQVGSGRDVSYERDNDATDIANVKADQIKREFTNWIRNTDKEVGGGKLVAEVVEDSFNETVNVVRPPTYTGDWVSLPDQSGEIWLKPHRKAVLARMITQGYGMMAHGVGSGKTLGLVALAHELKRLGKARKPVIVAMNSTVEQFAASYKKAYPQAKLLVANSQGNFSASKRAMFYSQMATGDFDAIIMPHSTLKQIPHTDDAIKSFYRDQEAELMETLKNIDKGDKQAMTQIRKAIDGLREKMKAQQSRAGKHRDSGALTWEDIGIDAVLVDEAHAFKNAPVVTKMKNVKNLPTGEASDNALSMMMKVNTVQKRTGGRNVYFATGTPITNTMAEAYVMIRYLAPDRLKELGINSFDDFADSFAETATKPEANWKGQVSMTTRLAKFVNGQALVNMIRSVFDVALGNDNLGLYVPRVKGGKPEQVVIESSATAGKVNDWFLDVADAYDQIPKKELKDDPKLGAIPIVTMQAGIAAATDPRLVDPRAPDDPGSKVNVMVDRMMGIYEAGKEQKTAQVIFSDIRNPFNVELLADQVGGMPFDGEAGAGDGKFDLFEEIKRKLVERGVKPEEIWWPPDGIKPEKLAEAFDKVNDGSIRVIIGSTQRIGTGANFQERLAAAHHLGPPRDMKPAMMEQRNGRIIRQGNLHREWADNAFTAVVEKAAGKKFPGDKPKSRREAAEKWMEANLGTSGSNLGTSVQEEAQAAAAQYEIQIMEYALENSIDSAIFSMMAAKQGFIAQALSDVTTESEFEDPSDEVQMGMAEIAARTMGDADMIRLVEMEREVKDLRARAAAHSSGISAKRAALRKAKAQAQSQESAKAALDSWGDRHVGLFDDPKKPPLWKFGEFTHDPKDKSKKATGLTGGITTWLSTINAGSRDLKVGDVSLEVTVFGGGKMDTREGSVAIIADDGTQLTRRDFRGAASLIQHTRASFRDLDGMKDRLETSMDSTSKEIATLSESDLTAPFPGNADLNALETEFAAVQSRVQTRLAEEKDARAARRGAMSATSGAINAGNVERLAMGETPYLDLEADWSQWPLAETVMDILGMPEGTRKMMRKKPRLNVMERFAGGPAPLERAMENAGLSMGNSDTLSMAETPQENAENTEWDDHEAIRTALDYLSGNLPSVEVLDERRETALNEADGERTVGNPDIANVAEQEDIRREFDVVREAYEASMKGETHDQWNESAHALIKKDADGVMRALLEFAREGVAIDSPVMVKAAQIMIPRVWSEAKASGDPKAMRDAQALTLAYQMAGSVQARALGARRDPHKTPEERHLEMLANVISKVPPEVEKAAKSAPTPAAKNREIERLRRELKNANGKETGSKKDTATIKRLKKELAAAVKQKDRAEILAEAHERRLAKVEEALREMGITLHEIFSHQAVVRLRGSEIVARIIEENFSKNERAALRGRIDKVSPNKLKKTTGLAKADIIAAQQRFKGLMRKRFFELGKRGLTMTDFQQSEEGFFDLSKRIAEDGSVLRMAETSGISDAKANAAADEMMDALFGDEKSYRKGTARKPGKKGETSFNPGNRTHAAQAARGIQSAIDGNAYDMAYEYWINNILGGPQTQSVNIAGNLLNTALEYIAQRPTEAMYNLFVGAEDGATFGEFNWMAKALPKAIAPSVKHAVLTWVTEESFLEADLLRDPALIGERFEKVVGSGGSGSRTAIPDKIAGIGTTGARSLPGAFKDFMTGQGWKGFSVGRTVRIPGRMLLFMDTLMKSMVAHTEVAAVAYRKAKADGMKGQEMEDFISEEMSLPGSPSWFGAMEKGREITFTSELKSFEQGGGMFEQLVRALQKNRIAGKQLGPATAFLVGWFFPFIQTPFNIFKSGLRRTPFGMMGILANVMKAGLYSRKKGSPRPFIETYPKALMIRDMADQTMAWITTMFLLALTEGDDDDDDKPILITGSRPYGIDSSGERALLDRTEGGSMQIRVGKRGPDAVYFDYGRMEPFATVLASIADSVRAIKRVENGADKATELTKLRSYALSQAQDKTFLQGIAKINDAINPSQSMGHNIARNLAHALVPNMIRQPLRNLDDYVRDTKTAPWYYHVLPVGGFAEPQYDLYGNPMKKGLTPGGSLLPAAAERASRIVTDTGLEPDTIRHPADTALVNWNRKNPQKSEQYFPSKNSIYTFKDLLGNRHDLTRDQVAALNQRGGKKLDIILRGQISPAEAENPTVETIDKIKSARARVFRETRDEIVKEPIPRPRKGFKAVQKARSLSEAFGWNKP